MRQSPYKKLLWLAILSLFCPLSEADCETQNSVVEGVCAAGSTAAGITGGVTCAVTFGIGCVVAVASAAVGATCATGAFSPDCGGVGNTFDTTEILAFLHDIEESVDQLHMQIDVGFFEAKYTDAFQSILQALDGYDHDVIGKSSMPGMPGIIAENILTRDWKEAVLQGQWDVRGALSTIEDMIEGRDYLTSNPSVYELAHNAGFCTVDLFDFVTSLIVEGTTLVFIALEMHGTGVHDLDTQQMEARLKLNSEMFNKHCVRSKLFCSTQGNDLWVRDPIHSDINWERVGHANNLVGMTSLDDELYCITSRNRLYVRPPALDNTGWTDIGHAYHVVAFTSLNGKLYCVTSFNKLYVRDPVHYDVSWKHIGHANNMVAMAGINGKLWCATSDNNLWVRHPYEYDTNWTHVGHANHLTSMATLNGKIYCTTSNNRLFVRDPVEYDVSWTHIGHANGVVAMAGIVVIG